MHIGGNVVVNILVRRVRIQKVNRPVGDGKSLTKAGKR